MMLRPGNAGSNTPSEHITVLADALAQLPRGSRGRTLIRLDGAGASHTLIEHLLSPSTARRKVAFTSGFTITAREEAAIAHLPEHAWTAAVEQDGSLDPVAQVAELTGLWRRTGWPDGLRYIARRVKPTRRHAKTGLLPRPPAPPARPGRRPGTHREGDRDQEPAQPRLRAEQGLAAGREHRLRPARLPPTPRLDERDDLAAAEPETLRATILHIPARLTSHARQRILKIEQTWPWARAVAEAWDRLGAIPAPA
jgi:hypothetical protein